MNDDALVEVLRDADLSPYQAEAYVTLLDIGTATATDVVDACDVPDPRIYDVLRDLEEKGYVETFQQDALTARAHEPATVLEDLRTRSKEYLAAADEIEERWNRPPMTDHEVSIVKRMETVVRRTRGLIDDAHTHVQLACDVEQFRSLRSDLAEARDRGVAVEVSLAVDDPATLPDESVFEGVCTEVRVRSFETPFVAVVDKDWTCFAPGNESGSEYGVLVSDRAYTYVFDWFFLTCLWEVWDRCYSARGADAVSFVDVRRCVRAVADLLEAGEAVEAHVEGFEAGTDEPVEVSGRIVDVTYPGESADVDGRVPLSHLAGRVGIVLDTGDERVSICGKGRTDADVEAATVQVEGDEP